MTDKARLFIADDHYAVLDGIKITMAKDPDFEVVGSATDGSQAPSMIEKLKPDIVILDISMPNMDGMEAARQMGSGRAI